MNTEQQAAKAKRLRELHSGPRILVLPNAWDVVSARLIEEAGYPAIATTSAGVAAVLGYPDGENLSRCEMLEIVARIARAVSVPVTADMEAGYGTTPEDMADTARALIEAGAVGLNLEDVIGEDAHQQIELPLQVAKIRAIKETSAKLGVPLVINARTDVYLATIGPEETRFERTVERLRAYREAGADCLFAPGIRDGETIAKLVKALGGPLNILISPGCPSITELEKMGVARVSAGSAVMRAALGLVRRIAQEMRDTGSYSSLLADSVTYAEVNRILGKI
jgi:2-methylisocitrate lyase-like PEP mutase family enzyme